jgi:hypothetical protein
MSTETYLVDIENMSLVDLRERLLELDGERTVIQNEIRRQTESVFYVPSFAEGHLEHAIESLGLPALAERYIGRKGLGIRTIDQLTTYSAAFLEDQLDQYLVRAEIFNLSELSTQDMVEAIQAKLALQKLSLAV